MDATTLRFDPASEFEVLETLDFEEEIQRPESMRFFTLEEQLLDYFDKVLPRDRKVTKFEYKKIASDVDRLREIYNRSITLTDTEYIVDQSRKHIHVNWVTPLYAPYTYAPYSYAQSWVPLFQPELRRTPNYYPRMLAALPKPYRAGAEGVPYHGRSTMVDEDGKRPIHVLGTYERTKGVLHEDGSFSVVPLPIGNTADEMKTLGFYIAERDPIPNPLAEHPFLASNKASVYRTVEPLERVFPTIETILEHGVPKTSDPYGEGMKYLRLYDTKLTQIPWNAWKERFPPVDTIIQTPPIPSIVFPQREDVVAPSKPLLDMYVRPWSSGLEPRFWLMMQEDRGVSVNKLLLTQASKAGLVPPRMVEPLPSQAISSTPEECFTFDTFDGLMNAGIYRLPAWSSVALAIQKNKPFPTGTCVPMPQIMQEKTLYGSKIPWTDTTPADIVRDHRELLTYYQYRELPPRVRLYETYASQPKSEIRKQIEAVLKDPERDPSDKASATMILVRGNTQTNELWYAPDDRFLVCNHTLALLQGDLDTDRLAYYERWTAIDDGYRSCKFCGEQINRDVLVAQDDFDENGNVIISHDRLESDAFQGHGNIESISNSLLKRRVLFQLEHPGESILYLLCSLLQVLPDESQLLPVLHFMREMTAVLRANKKIDKQAKERIEGILGIVGMTTLLLIHDPFLIPRRSFGSNMLKLTGFPRDGDESDTSALDTVIGVLRTTFESSPSTFKGGIATVFRLILRKPRDVRKEAILFLKQAQKKFDAQFRSAKERYDVPTTTEVVTYVSLPAIRVTQDTFVPTDTLQEEAHAECHAVGPHAFLSGRYPPSVLQDPMILHPSKPSAFAEPVDSTYEPPQLIQISDADIRRRAALGFPRGVKLEKIEAFLRSDTDGIAILALLNRLVDILSEAGYKGLADIRTASVYLRSSGSLLRDAARGLVYELLHDVVKHANKAAWVGALSTAIQRDLSLQMILITKEQATRQESDLRTRERETFKLRMRNMNDTEREVTKMLLDIGIAPYVITNEDRELFAREYNLPDPEADYAARAADADIDRPEEGYNAERDVEDDMAAVVNGNEQQVDYGDYGDRREEPVDRDYEKTFWGNLDDDYGI